MSWDALAAVAVSTGAIAQVTISGALDVAAFSTNKVETDVRDAANTDVNTNLTGSVEGWGTNELRISGSEDLGGGLTASFSLNTRANGTAFFADRDRFLQLSGDFGSFRMGRFEPASAQFGGFVGARTTNQAGSLTGVTGGVGAAAGVPGGLGAAMRGGDMGRQDGMLQYTSPDFSGFTVNASYGRSNTATNSNRDGSNVISQRGLGLNFTTGDLALGLGTNTRTVNTEVGSVGGAQALCIDAGVAVAPTTVGAADACPAGQFRATSTATGVDQRDRAVLNWLGGSYDFGVARVMASQVRRTGDTTPALTGVTARDTNLRVNAVGVAVPLGAVTLAGNMYNGTNTTVEAGTGDFRLTGHQLSATYSFSSRTTLYAVVGENKSARRGADNPNNAAKRTSNAVGLNHTF